MTKIRDDAAPTEDDPSARWAEFTVCIKDDPPTNHSGRGVTLDSVIAEETVKYRRRFEYMERTGRESAEEFVDNEPDMVVWSDLRVLAVLRPNLDGDLDRLTPALPARIVPRVTDQQRSIINSIVEAIGGHQAVLRLLG
jgi:hypothetical protein